MYLALTGARLNVMDALYTGIATHFVPMERWEDLLSKIGGRHGRSCGPWRI